MNDTQPPPAFLPRPTPSVVEAPGPDPRTPTHAVYTVVDRDGGGRSAWVRIGSAYTNRDGSLTLKLDALPVHGTMQVRALTAAG